MSTKKAEEPASNRNRKFQVRPQLLAALDRLVGRHQRSVGRVGRPTEVLLMTPAAQSSLALLMAYLMAHLTVDVYATQPAARFEERPAPKLDSKWNVVRTEFGGKVEPKAGWVQLAWAFAGGKATVSTKGGGGRPGRDMAFPLTTDPDKGPKEMTLRGPDPKLGFAAIYKFDSNELVVVWNAGSQSERPKKFETTRADFFTMVRLNPAK